MSLITSAISQNLGLLATEAAIIGSAFLLVHFGPWAFRKLRAVLAYDLPRIDESLLDPPKTSGALWYTGTAALSPMPGGVTNSANFSTISGDGSRPFMEERIDPLDMAALYGDMDRFEREDGAYAQSEAEFWKWLILLETVLGVVKVCPVLSTLMIRLDFSCRCVLNRRGGFPSPTI